MKRTSGILCGIISMYVRPSDCTQGDQSTSTLTSDGQIKDVHDSTHCMGAVVTAARLDAETTPGVWKT